MLDIFSVFSEFLERSEATDIALSGLSAEEFCDSYNPVRRRTEFIGGRPQGQLARRFAELCGVALVFRSPTEAEVFGTEVSMGIWSTYWPQMRKAGKADRAVLLREMSSLPRRRKIVRLYHERRVARDRVLQYVCNAHPELRLWPDEPLYKKGGPAVQFKKNKNIGGIVIATSENRA